MRPKDFWRLHPDEVHWLIDAMRPAKAYAGGMTEDEVAELYNDAYGED